MATLKLYEGKDSILTFEGTATLNLTPTTDGMNLVINSQEKLVLVRLTLADIKRLALDGMALVHRHGELRDKLIL
jgi:hypothetical protein